MKPQSWVLPVRWLLVVVLCVLTILSPMALTSIPAYAQSSHNDTQTPKVNTPPAARLLSIYDGTYTGTFNYEYQVYRTNEKGDGWVAVSGWIPASFSLTVTLTYKSISSGMVNLDITKITCSDPAFGTGPDGITPVDIPSQPRIVKLPLSTPATHEIGGFEIYFPNGARLRTPETSNDLSVSSGGQTLSGSTWQAITTQGPLLNPSLWYDTAGQKERLETFNDHKFKSWSLTKVSSQYDTQSLAQNNREMLEAAIKADDVKGIYEAATLLGDVQGILEAYAKAKVGLMNPKEEELPTTTIPPTTTSPDIISFERPEQGGVVDLSSESFNLKLRQLYGASSGEEAREIYDNKVNARKQELDASLVKSRDRIKEIDEELRRIKATPLSPLEQKVLDFQKEQALEKANKRVFDAWVDLFMSLPKPKPKDIMDATGVSKFFGRDIWERWDSGESLNWRDAEKIALLGVDIIVLGATLPVMAGATLPVIAGGSTIVAAWGTGVLLASAGIELWSAYSAVSTLEDKGGKVQPDIEKYEKYRREYLEHMKDLEKATIEHLNHEEERWSRLGIVRQK
ncbi:MAG: hypothetical protein HY529_05800 [Chloroflexi bacterium]|nr:hypothetical protein [Chloroflexota bacterium]